MKRRFGLAVLALVLCNVVRIEACAQRDDAEERLAYLAQRIAADDFGLAPGQPFDGEWRLTTLSMTSMAARHLAVTHPQTREERARQVSTWAAKITTEAVRAYDTRQWGNDALTGQGAHVGYLGHAVLTLDAACLLGGERDAELHRRMVNILARHFEASPTGLVETYPGEIYVPDNVVGVAAIAQYDACTGEPRHAGLIARWLSKVKDQWMDDGLLVFAPGQPARGSGAAWNSLYLPLIDESFAAEQSDRMWARFGDAALGGWLRGVKEGVEGDVDSGPLVMGVSPAATGFALGDATLRDRPERRGLLRTAELAGISFGGRYLLAPLVGDAMVLAARTMTHAPVKPSSVKVFLDALPSPGPLASHGGWLRRWL